MEIFKPSAVQQTSYADLVNAVDPEQLPVGFSSDMLLASKSFGESFSFDSMGSHIHIQKIKAIAFMLSSLPQEQRGSIELEKLPFFASLSISSTSSTGIAQDDETDLSQNSSSGCCQISSVLCFSTTSFTRPEDIFCTSTSTDGSNSFTQDKTGPANKPHLTGTDLNSTNKISFMNMKADSERHRPRDLYSLCGTFDSFSFDAPTSIEDNFLDGSEVEYLEAPFLYQSIEDKAWDSVISRLKTHPHEASIWVFGGAARNSCENAGNMTRSVAWKILPLHAACIFGSTSRVISALIHAFPESVNIADFSGKLPLHLACYSCHSADVVRVLLKASPYTLHAPDSLSAHPINLSLSSHGIARDEILSLLDHGISSITKNSRPIVH